jgi:hypothetical protein
MIVLDVETTGLYPERNSLVSIGALDWDQPTVQFYEECRIWDGAEVAPEALKVNGLSEAALHDPSKQTEADLVRKFLAWLKDKRDITVAGQNCYVDVAFVNAALKRAGEREALPKRIFEQHSIVLYHMLLRGLTPPILDRRSALDSDSIMTYVGLPPEPKPHIAINGALWEYEALHRLVYGKVGLDQFKKYELPWQG